ncbi:P-loop containing nucleoside triphosphate hydrolase protein [Sistotremastrum niveocremeum HHB9708]|uniref:DNA 3'-5' helicase n=1 Tax=Sistotremastrum niveocremeum HHB9708 TaxID=1314777 RepID=A0A164QVV8_9AGAM|nr:P-loop containing nucleoside triphosphate hydrolase protein [Sistotremastrum niveocremeum HHB9708]
MHASADIYRGLFKFGVFNAVQSQCFSQVNRLYSQTQSSLTAPTGSGKTVLFELAVIRLFAKLQGHASSCKCIYLAPTKALCSERYRDWSAKFEVLGITCCELTGDTVIDGRDPWGNAKNASIIISTPEKLDSLSRQWNDHVTILSQIKVFLVHILNETRGSVLEVVISRMKARGSAIRFMLVSATVPNIEDIAAWIKGHSNENTVVKQFGEEYRSCKLTRFVKAYPKKNQNDFQFNRKLDFELYAAMEEHSERKPVLIFVATRKGVIGTADQLSKDFTKALEQRRNTPWQKPARYAMAACHMTSLTLDFATNGIGVHHAGLSMEDRRMTETLFLNRTLHVVVATSTLAMGVNLPAHTVVIKGTRIWQDTEWKEYSDLDVIQMMGRALTPVLDKEGVVIIMCDSQSEYKYQRMKAGETVIESSLHMNLVEHLNSEIGLGTITDTASANLWLQDSFLYQRIQKNPSRYGLTGQAHDSWRQRLEALVTNSINKLRETELVQDLDGKDRFCLTEFGEIMSKYYLRHTTVCLILDLNPCASVRDIVYNLIKDDDAIRFKIKKVEKPADKTFILIQAILGGVSLSNPIYKSPDSQPHLDAMTVFRHASRIVRVVGDVAIAKQNGAQLKHSMDLLRSLNAKAWEDRPIVLRQLDKLGEKSYLFIDMLSRLAVVLASHGITSIPILRAQNAVRLGNLLNRKRQFGEELLASANELPQYTVSVSEVSVATFGGTQPIAATLEVICGLEKQLVEPTKSKKNKRSLGMTTVLTLTSDYKWIDYRRIPQSFSVVASLDKPSQSVVVHISPVRTSVAYLICFFTSPG